jgi:hypothetical protein
MSRVHCIVIAVEKLIAYSRITSWAPDSSSEWKPVKKNTGATKLEFPSFQFAYRHGASQRDPEGGARLTKCFREFEHEPKEWLVLSSAKEKSPAPGGTQEEEVHYQRAKTMSTSVLFLL